MSRKAVSPIFFGVSPEEEWPERFTQFRCPSLRNSSSVSPDDLRERQLPPFTSFDIQPTRCFEYFKPAYECKSSCSLRITDFPNSGSDTHNTPVPPQTAPASRSSPTFLSPYGLRNMSVSWTDQARPVSLDPQRSEQKDEKEQQPSEKLVWVNLLNQWIPEDRLTMPYQTFVSNAPTEEKWFTHRQALIPRNFSCKACERHEVHMAKQLEKLNIPLLDLRAYLHMLYTFRGFKKKKKTDGKHSPERKVHSTPPYISYSSDKNVWFQTSESEVGSPVDSLSLENQCSLPHLAWDSDKELTEVLPEKQMSYLQINVTEVEEELVLPVLAKTQVVLSPEKSSVGSIEDEDEESEVEGDHFGGSTTRVVVSGKDTVPITPSGSLSPLHTTDMLRSPQAEIDSGKRRKSLSPSKQLQEQSLTLQKQGKQARSPRTRQRKNKNKKLPKKCRKKSGKRRKSLSPSKQLQEQSLTLQKQENQEIHESVEEEEDLSSEKQKTTIIQKKRREIVRKERVQRRETEVIEETVTENRLLPTLPETNRIKSWIFDDEDFSEEKQEKKITVVAVDVGEPAISEAVQSIESRLEEKKKKNRKKSINAVNVLISKQKNNRRPPPGISEYNDELQRFQKGEERRKKQQDAIKRHKSKKSDMQQEEDEDLGIPQFEDYGFLSQYCILNRANMKMYKRAFDAVDETRKGWLSGTDVMIALKGVNNKLTETAEVYLYRVLELIGFKVTDGADFKLFSVLSALSVKLSSLDEWMKNIIDNMDFKALDMKMFTCKKLWECNVDKSINKISLDQLCIELRAGGVSLKHEMEVREKLGYMVSLDLLDFLTYIPLFIMIHMSVVGNPLDDSRNK